MYKALAVMYVLLVLAAILNLIPVTLAVMAIFGLAIVYIAAAVISVRRRR